MATKARSAIYAFTVLSLVAFLLGLFLWRPQVISHQAQAVVQIAPVAAGGQPIDNLFETLGILETAGNAGTEPSSAGPSPQGLQTYLSQTLQSPAFLIRAAEAAGIQGDDEAKTRWAWHVLDSLRVDVRTDRQGDVEGVNTFVRLRMQSANARSARQATDAVAQTLATHLDQILRQPSANETDVNDSTSESLVLARPAQEEAWDSEPSSTAPPNNEEWHQAREEVDEARRVLDEYVQSELDRRRREWQRTQNDVTAVDSNSTTYASAADTGVPEQNEINLGLEQSTATVPNPEYVAIQEKLTRAETERVELLKRVTEIHPEVMLVDNKIADLRQRLAETPATIDAPASSGESDSATSEFSNQSFVTGQGEKKAFDENQTLAEIQQDETTRLLQQRLVDAQRRLDGIAVLGRQQAPSGGENSGDSEAIATVSISDPAEVVARQRGAWNAMHVGLVGGGALLVAFVFSVIPGRSIPLPVFATEREVATSLDLPLVGTLTTEDGPAIPRSPGRDLAKPTRWLMSAGEWALVALLLVCVLMCFLDKTWFSKFVQSPFDAYLGAIDRVLSAVGIYR
ncbi:MAG: hypothetical protein KDA60_02580 [Planctomycetales bacterium]|nr:hypothetical protein [Planctomycetales bacterium]